MKKLWIILLILLVIVIALLLVFNFIKKKKVDINKLNIKSMRFSYSTSTMMNGNVSYEINYKDDKYIASIKPNNKSEEEKLVIELDKETLDKVINILNEYNVSSWNKFNKHNKNVLDGNGFSFSLRTQDDKEITASGYMMYPDNYGKVSGSLDEIFNKIYEENYIEDLTYLYLSYSNGDEANSDITLKLEKKDDKYIVSIKPRQKTDKETKDIEVNKEFIEKVELILNKYNTSTWDGFHKSDTNVLDGDSFSFSLKYKDKKVSAGGYMMYPNNYAKVEKELTDMFMELY